MGNPLAAQDETLLSRSSPTLSGPTRGHGVSPRAVTQIRRHGYCVTMGQAISSLVEGQSVGASD